MATATCVGNMATQQNIASKVREKEEKEGKEEKGEKESIKLKVTKTAVTLMVQRNRTIRRSTWEESLSGGRMRRTQASGQ